jgi:N-acetylmuramoyl-L-alanine amidase
MFRKIVAILTLYLIAGFIYAQDARFVVVIDAGHGGHDPGAIGDISKEKDINLAISLELGTIIEQNFKDVKVVFTRKIDEYLTLQERADIVNNNHADLFICIHTNSAKSTAAFGTESFTLGLAKSKANLDVAMRENSVILLEDNYKTKYKGFDPTSVDSYIMFEFMQDKYIDKSVEIASSIQNQFSVYCHRSDRGVRQAGFWVLHRSACPSVLVEVGFVSNPSEERYLNSPKGRREMATAIYNAVVLYKRDHDKRSGKRISVNSPKVELPTKINPTTTDKNDQMSAETPSSKNIESTASSNDKKEENKSKNENVTNQNQAEISAKNSEGSTKTKLSKVLSEVSESTKVKKDSVVGIRLKSDSSQIKKNIKSNLAYIPNQSTRIKSNDQKTNAPNNKSIKNRINIVNSDSENEPEKNLKSTLNAKDSIQNKRIEVKKQIEDLKSELPVFKLQILASAKSLKLSSLEFKGQSGVEMFEEGGWFKYTIGKEIDYKQILKLKHSVQEKFPKAFVIAFYKNKKISEQEALKIKLEK